MFISDKKSGILGRGQSGPWEGWGQLPLSNTLKRRGVPVGDDYGNTKPIVKVVWGDTERHV